MLLVLVATVFLLSITLVSAAPQGFVTTNGQEFELDGEPFVWIFTLELGKYTNSPKGVCREQFLCRRHR